MCVNINFPRENSYNEKGEYQSTLLSATTCCLDLRFELSQYF